MKATHVHTYIVAAVNILLTRGDGNEVWVDGWMIMTHVNGIWASSVDFVGVQCNFV